MRAGDVTAMPRAPGAVVPPERGPMHADAVEQTRARPRQRHLRVALVPLEDLPQRCGREVAEDRVAAARLDGREPAALAWGIGVPDRVDAAVEAVQPAACARGQERRRAVQPARAELERATARPTAPQHGAPPPGRKLCRVARPSGRVSSTKLAGKRPASRNDALRTPRNQAQPSRLCDETRAAQWATLLRCTVRGHLRPLRRRPGRAARARRGRRPAAGLDVGAVAGRTRERRRRARGAARTAARAARRGGEGPAGARHAAARQGGREGAEGGVGRGPAQRARRARPRRARRRDAARPGPPRAARRARRSR